MVFASPYRQFYRDMTTRVRLSGLSSSGQIYCDTKVPPTYRDCAKTHANPDTVGNSPYHQTVRVH
jgi:hypothetical protein